MAWNNEILRPNVSLVITRTNQDTGTPTHGLFRVVVDFVGGTYPSISYDTNDGNITELEQSESELITKMEERVNKWKAKHDFISSKQALIETSLDGITWGV